MAHVAVPLDPHLHCRAASAAIASKPPTLKSIPRNPMASQPSMGMLAFPQRTTSKDAIDLSGSRARTRSMSWSMIQTMLKNYSLLVAGGIATR